MDVGILLVAAIIGAIPTAAIGVLGFSLRRSEDLSRLLAYQETQGQAIDRLEGDLREERKKREEAVGRCLMREDWVRYSTMIDRKLDVIGEKLSS